MRRSTSDEIQAFIRLAADAFFAGRIDWQNAMEGYPIFLIKAADPDFPDDDINTGLRLDEVTAPRPPRAFGIPIEDLTALYAGVRSRQAQHAA